MENPFSRFTKIAGGSFTSSYRNPMTVEEELRSRFGVLVSMNDCHTAPKGTAMATFGLNGCIAGYIGNTEKNTLFHYDPLNTSKIDNLLRQEVTDKTTRVHFFVPGQWSRNSDGRYEQQPKPEYAGRLLGAMVARIQSLGIECAFSCYDENKRVGDDYMARSQGTVWIDKNGQLFSEGMPVRGLEKKSGSDPSCTIK